MILAVLPFDNLSRDPDQEFFSDGLTEEMIAQLGKLNPERLTVISHHPDTRTAAPEGREPGSGGI